MVLDWFSFAFGFIAAGAISTLTVLLILEKRKRRALAFTKRFATISEGLSSLKALSFRVLTQISQLKIEDDEISVDDIERLQQGMRGMQTIFQTISAGMMPPTEEIALDALRGKNSSIEKRAYEDSKKFRDDIRRLRKQLESEGLEGLATEEVEVKDKPTSPIKIT